MVDMNTANLKDFTAAAKRLADQTKSTGPTTEQGKLKSSLNAVRHGLAAKNLLLPGEDAETYESRMDGVFTSLAPTDEAQAQLAALVADDIWKLDRLAKIEQGLLLGRIEELLGLTEAAESSGRTVSALNALGTALRGWEAQPIPTERDQDFLGRLTAMSEALDVVEGLVAGLPADLMHRSQDLLAQLHYSVGGRVVPTDAYAELFKVAGKVMVALMGRGDRDVTVQQELRKAIATIALPNEADLKKLARYRKLLEEGLQRRLQALEQLRKLAVASPVAETTEKAREYRVKLRVVA